VTVHVAGATGAVLPAQYEQIPLVQRRGPHANDDLAGSSGWCRNGFQGEAECFSVTLELVLSDCLIRLVGCLSM
jgi:hypothetical protein